MNQPDRDDVIAAAILLRVYASLAPESAVRALLAADTTALTQALAETRQQAYEAGFRDGAAYDAGIARQAAIDHRRAVAIALGPTPEELARVRGEAGLPDPRYDHLYRENT